MTEKETLIQEFVAKAIPKALLSDVRLEDVTGNTRTDAAAWVSLGKEKGFHAYFEMKNTLSLAALMDSILLLKQCKHDGNNAVSILLSSYLSDKKQTMLRENGIGFIDSLGNAWIETDTILIDRRGNKPDQAFSLTKKGQNIFSDKATLVSRLLFNGAQRGVREISSTLETLGFSLSPGYVSKVIASLTEERYIKQGSQGAYLINRELFLEDWVSVYKRKKARETREGWYCPSSNVEELAFHIGSQISEHGVLTDRAGSYFYDQHVSFESVDVIVRDRKGVQELLRALNAKPVDRGANINLIDPYYRVSAFFGIQKMGGVHVASNLQLYLDLSCQPKRGLEAAEHLYQQRILPLINGEVDV